MKKMKTLLATHAGRREFEREIATLIRSGELATAESFLTEGLTAYPSRFTNVCLELALETITIHGWDELNAGIEVRATKAAGCSALGVNLSNYTDPDVEIWHRKEPALEVAYYSDQRFPFSTATRNEILSHCETDRRPWQGCFEASDWALSCRGLLNLNSALLSYESELEDESELAWPPQTNNPEALGKYVGSVLGSWFMHLRFHQAMQRELAARGLARRIPVLLGTHNLGPFINSVYFVTKLADHQATTARILAERRARSRARRDQATEEKIARFRQMRDYSGPRNLDNKTGLNKVDNHHHEKTTYSGLQSAGRAGNAQRGADAKPTRGEARGASESVAAVERTGTQRAAALV